MSANDLKLSINKMIESINDKTILEAYHEILVKLQKSQPAGYNTSGNPITKEMLDQKITEAQRQMDEGNAISHEEFKKEMDNW